MKFLNYFLYQLNHKCKIRDIKINEYFFHLKIVISIVLDYKKIFEQLENFSGTRYVINKFFLVTLVIKLDRIIIIKEFRNRNWVNWRRFKVRKMEECDRWVMKQGRGCWFSMWMTMRLIMRDDGEVIVFRDDWWGVRDVFIERCVISFFWTNCV